MGNGGILTAAQGVATGSETPQAAANHYKKRLSPPASSSSKPQTAGLEERAFRMATVPQASAIVAKRPLSSVPGASADAGVKVASGLPWILPALVLCVGLIYYCIGYTG